MDPIATALTLKALDGLAARAAATSQNIANAQTPGYRPARVRFEEALAAAAGRGATAIGAVKPQVEAEFTTDALGSETGVRLDQEVATASTTALRYSALVEVLNRQLQIEDLVISGGR